MRKTFTLPNGVRVILVPVSNALYAGVAVALAAGSRYEENGQSGGFHLLEHLMIHAVEPFPTFEALVDTIDRYATDCGAITRPTAMTFSFEAKRGHILHCIDLVADIVLRPVLSRDVLNHELASVAEEQILDDDDAATVVGDEVEKLTFTGDRLGQSISGSGDYLETVTVKQLREWHRTIACGERIAIAVVGNFDPAKVERQIRRKFGRLPRGLPATFQPFTFSQRTCRHQMQEAPTRALHIAIGFPTFGFGHPDRPALSVLNNHLGAEVRWGNQLTRQLRRTGLVYSVRSSVWHYTDAGLLSIRTAMHPDKAIRVLEVIGNELSVIRRSGLTEEQLESAKRSLKNDAQGRQYAPQGEAIFYAQQMLAMNDVLTYKQFATEVDAVWQADVHRVAQIFDPRQVNVVLVGPLDGLGREQVCDTLCAALS